MKKQLFGVVAAILTAAAVNITAGAEYYIKTESNSNEVKAEVIASGATLPAMEFTVELPEDIEVNDVDTVSGAVYNEENGRFAWADVKAPKDGTVMYSVTFTIDDGYVGEITITPAEGYEDDMPSALTAEIIGDDTENDDEEDNEENNQKDDEEDNADSEIPSSDNSESSSNNNSGALDDDSNPATGVAISCAGAAVAGAAVLATLKRKKK